MVYVSIVNILEQSWDIVPRMRLLRYQLKMSLMPEIVILFQILDQIILK